MNIIATRRVELYGLKFEVKVLDDTDSTPYDMDSYSPSDVARWQRGEWHYVGLDVSLVGDPGPGVQLWGVEYGDVIADSPNSCLDIDSYIDRVDYIVTRLDGSVEKFTLVGSLADEYLSGLITHVRRAEEAIKVAKSNGWRES